MKDMSTGESVHALEIEWRDHLARNHRRLEPRCVAINRARRHLAKSFALIVPRGPAEDEWRVLDVRRYDVRSRRCERRIGHGWNRELNPGFVRKPTVLRGIECALDR